MTAALALADCGPCSGTGALVRDHLPLNLSPEARGLILTRLEHGEQTYGAPLRVGWRPAAIERVQELCDAVAYAVADPDCPPEDLAAIVSLCNRATRQAITSGAILDRSPPMTTPKIAPADVRAALRTLARVGVKALRYSAGGFTTTELRDLAADVAEIAIALLAAADADGEG